MSRRPSPIRQVLFRPCFAGSGLWILFTGYAISSTQHPSAFIGYIIVPPIAVGRARADPALGLPAPRRTRGARRGYGRAFKERDLASGAGRIVERHCSIHLATTSPSRVANSSRSIPKATAPRLHARIAAKHSSSRSLATPRAKLRNTKSCASQVRAMLELLNGAERLAEVRTTCPASSSPLQKARW